jgi:hypothetical protein
VANIFKKIGKGLKKLGKAVGKVVSKVAPVAAFIPGVGTAVAAAAGAVGGKLSSMLGKGGHLAQAAANKLGQVKQILDSGKGGAPQPVNAQPPPEAYTTVEASPQPAPSYGGGGSYGPPAPEGYGQPAPSGGIPTKYLLIGGGALVALFLLTRRK